MRNVRMGAWWGGGFGAVAFTGPTGQAWPAAQCIPCLNERFAVRQQRNSGASSRRREGGEREEGEPGGKRRREWRFLPKNIDGIDGGGEERLSRTGGRLVPGDP